MCLLDGGDRRSGGGGSNSGYIGLDTVSITSDATDATVPDPASAALAGPALAGLMFSRRKQNGRVPA